MAAVAMTLSLAACAGKRHESVEPAAEFTGSEHVVVRASGVSVTAQGPAPATRGDGFTGTEDVEAGQGGVFAGRYPATDRRSGSSGSENLD